MTRQSVEGMRVSHAGSYADDGRPNSKSQSLRWVLTPEDSDHILYLPGGVDACIQEPPPPTSAHSFVMSDSANEHFTLLVGSSTGNSQTQSATRAKSVDMQGLSSHRRLSSLEAPNKDHHSGRLSLQGTNSWGKARHSLQMTLSASGSFRTLRDMYQDNHIHTSQLQHIKTIGEGSFAVVDQCLYTPGNGTTAGSKPFPVAVKRLKVEHLDFAKDDGDLNSFHMEVNLLRKMKNRHIIQFIGSGCRDSSSRKKERETTFLVEEYMDGGTLKRMVLKQMLSPATAIYTSHDVLRWCLQVAQGIQYMHQACPQVIHRDLKLENILLKGKQPGFQEAKIADFGLVALVRPKYSRSRVKPQATAESRRAQQARNNKENSSFLKQLKGRRASLLVHDGSMSESQMIHELLHHKASSGLETASDLHTHENQQPAGCLGTFMYMAPEVYEDDGMYNEKVDVFSFGVILYELLHRYIMVAALEHKEDMERYASRVAQGFRPPISKLMPWQLRVLIKACWAQNPKQRPAMDLVIEKLKELEGDVVLDKFDADFHKAMNTTSCSCFGF